MHPLSSDYGRCSHRQSVLTYAQNGVVSCLDVIEMMITRQLVMFAMSAFEFVHVSLSQTLQCSPLSQTLQWDSPQVSGSDAEDANLWLQQFVGKYMAVPRVQLDMGMPDMAMHKTHHISL